MPDFYSEMTDNMKMLFDDILASLGQLPDEKKAFQFEKGIGFKFSRYVLSIRQDS